MCACERSYVCSRCAGTSEDVRYLDEPDPREQAERDRYEAQAAFADGRSMLDPDLP